MGKNSLISTQLEWNVWTDLIWGSYESSSVVVNICLSFRAQRTSSRQMVYSTLGEHSWLFSPESSVAVLHMGWKFSVILVEYHHESVNHFGQTNTLAHKRHVLFTRIYIYICTCISLSHLNLHLVVTLFGRTMKTFHLQPLLYGNVWLCAKLETDNITTKYISIVSTVPLPRFTSPLEKVQT